MNLALITPGFSAHAGHWAIPALQALATSLARRHRVTVFSLRYPAAGEYAFAGLRHVALGGGTRFGLRSGEVMGRAWRALLAAHREKPFDLIHAFWVDEPGFVAVLAGKRLGLPVVASSAGGEFVWLPDIAYGTQGSFFRRWLVRTTVRQAAVVTAGSAYQMGLAQGVGVPASRLVLAPYGLDGDHFRPGESGNLKERWLVQAASLVPVKGQRLLLQLFALAQGQMPALRLCLAGDGPLRADLQAEAGRLGLAGRVTWRGAVPYRSMPALFQGCALYVQSSRHESQGMAVLEGMACGLPAIGTPVGVMPQVAALPATASAEGLAAQAVTLLGDEALWAERSAQARQAVAASYGLEATTAHFEQLYQQLLAGGPAAA